MSHAYHISVPDEQRRLKDLLWAEIRRREAQQTVAAQQTTRAPDSVLTKDAEQQTAQTGSR